MKYLYAIIIACLFWYSGIIEDGLRAYKGTHQGDCYRLFQYYQSARWEGVPVALEKYGVTSKK